MPDLDQRLTATRDDLLDRIQIPELATVQARASGIRRRRRGVATASAALACVAAFGTGTALLGNRTAPPPPQAVASTDVPVGLYWQGGGLTLLAANDKVLEQLGDLRDVQFADTKHGYALSAECYPKDPTRPCKLALASTTDGGRTWKDWRLPIAEASPDRLPSIVAVGSDGLVLAGETAWFGHRGGDWQQRSVTSAPTTPVIPDGGRLTLLADDVGYATPTVAVWTADGAIARLATQPAMAVAWLAPAPAADGAWWVGGSLNGAPAVGVTRDDGRSWTVTRLPGGGGEVSAKVSTLGSDVYAVVVAPLGDAAQMQTIHAVYRSAAGGPFNLYASMIGTLVGDVVPLLDGRFVVASPKWYISAGPGATLEPAGGSMTWVGRIERTAGGWIAYDVHQTGWAAVSYDGVTWQKINVR